MKGHDHGVSFLIHFRYDIRFSDKTSILPLCMGVQNALSYSQYFSAKTIYLSFGVSVDDFSYSRITSLLGYEPHNSPFRLLITWKII